MGLYQLFTPETSGWIPPELRTVEVANRHLEIMDACPVVGTTGYYGARPKWSVAWEYGSRVANFDQWRRKGHVKNMQQITGSCVGFGAANMLLWTSITQMVYNADRYRVTVPFFGYHYGLGRLESGIRGRGEGSTGSGQAEALRKYGWLSFDSVGCPAPNNGETIEWSSGTEMQWSDGAGSAQALKPDGTKHVITAYTKAESRDQAKDLMASKYWGTTASNWGGRVAEELVLHDVTTGAGNDLERATDLARKMVCEWGMSEKLGPLTFGRKEEEIFLGREIGSKRDFSEQVALEIDHEVRRLVTENYERAKRILTDNMTSLKALAEALLEKEVLDALEIDQILIQGSSSQTVPA
jgi:hypothetical protein